MDLVLSLQKLAVGGMDVLELTSSNSNTCSSASTGGCVIAPTDPGVGGVSF